MLMGFLYMATGMGTDGNGLAYTPKEQMLGVDTLKHGATATNCRVIKHASNMSDNSCCLLHNSCCDNSCLTIQKLCHDVAKLVQLVQKTEGLFTFEYTSAASALNSPNENGARPRLLASTPG